MTKSDALLLEGRRSIRHGSLWLGGGALVTIFSYLMAGGGGRYVLAWGAILYGVVKLFTGMSQVAKARLQKTREVICPFCKESLELDAAELTNLQYTCPECGHNVQMGSAEVAGTVGQGSNTSVVCPFCKEELELNQYELQQQHYTCPECGNNVQM